MTGTLGAILTVSAIALAAPGAASATTCGGRLSGHQWSSCGVYEEISLLYGKVEETGGSGAMCVGPVTHNSEGYHYPDGWSCGYGNVLWEPPRVYAFGAFYNDSVTEEQWGLYSV
jgi:hypothetical protein